MSRDVWAAIGATIAVVVVSILGFRVLGGPANQRLCATFAIDSRDLARGSTPDRWIHPKGEYCFSFEASEAVPDVPYSY
jgi:hypothetical protein